MCPSLHKRLETPTWLTSILWPTDTGLRSTKRWVPSSLCLVRLPRNLAIGVKYETKTTTHSFWIQILKVIEWGLFGIGADVRRFEAALANVAIDLLVGSHDAPAPPHCSIPDSGTSITVRPCQKLMLCAAKKKKVKLNIHLNTIPTIPLTKMGTSTWPKAYLIFFKWGRKKTTNKVTPRFQRGWCPPPILHTSFGDSRDLLLTIWWRVLVSGPVLLKCTVKQLSLCSDSSLVLPSDSVPFQKQLLIWDKLCIENALLKPNAICLRANYPSTKYPRNLEKIAPGDKNTWEQLYSDVLELLEGKKAVISCDGSLQEQRTIRHVFMSLFPRRMSMVLALDISGQSLSFYLPTANYFLLELPVDSM